jgi:predicted negative regulator of RcsB-dependent stress response
MTLDLEEQEQLAALKAWWKEYGNLILLVVTGAAIAIGAWQGWRSYQRGQAQQASVVYETLARASDAGDLKVVREASGTLAEDYTRTLYAPLGALVAARFYFDRGDLKSAKAQLQWVMERSSSTDMQTIARLRLAAVLLDEGAHDEALKLLEVPHGDAYAAQYAALRGDILVAKKQIAEAKAAYRAALEKAQGDQSTFRDSVRMRLDALGG